MSRLLDRCERIDVRRDYYTGRLILTYRAPPCPVIERRVKIPDDLEYYREAILPELPSWKFIEDADIPDTVTFKTRTWRRKWIAWRWPSKSRLNDIVVNFPHWIPA